MSKGVFIVIEGTDGSGKETQTSLLVDALQGRGYEVALFDFPQYSKPSSYFVQQYLNGHYGDLDSAGPYTASLFFALDRYDAIKDIKQALEDGKVVIANRYTGSNMAHQGTKFKNQKERQGYFIWLDNLEYGILGVPRPNMNFVLRMPAEMAQQLVDKKSSRSYTDKKRDLHEADIDHLKKSVSVYDDLCSLFPQDFERIDCVRSNKLISIENIHTLLLEKVTAILPEPAARSKQSNQKSHMTAIADSDTMPPTNHPVHSAMSNTIFQPRSDYNEYFTVPPLFDAEVAATYSSALNAVYKLNSAMYVALKKHLSKDTSQSDEKISVTVYETLKYSLPVATTVCGLPSEQSLTSQRKNVYVQQLASEMLSNAYAIPGAKVQLMQCAPRNEFSIIPDILYPYSDVSKSEVAEAAENLGYDQKSTLLSAALPTNKTEKSSNDKVLGSVHYSFDILDSYEHFLSLENTSTAITATRQLLTPRFGYGTPDLIDECNLTELYEQCFEISLKLHSYLQQAGYTQETEYATLLGHYVRWQYNISAADMQKISATHPLRDDLVSLISEKHPHIGTYLQTDGTAIDTNL